MIKDLSKIYEIRDTDKYRNANSVWNAMADSDR
jgi:hypothetical protein